MENINEEKLIKQLKQMLEQGLVERGIVSEKTLGFKRFQDRISWMNKASLKPPVRGIFNAHAKDGMLNKKSYTVENIPNLIKYIKSNKLFFNIPEIVERLKIIEEKEKDNFLTENEQWKNFNTKISKHYETLLPLNIQKLKSNLDNAKTVFEVNTVIEQINGIKNDVEEVRINASLLREWQRIKRKWLKKAKKIKKKFFRMN